MHIGRSSYIPITWAKVCELDKACPFCFKDPKEKEEWVAHNPSHPIHKKCAIKLILQGRVTCPVCRDPLSLTIIQQFGSLLANHAESLASSALALAIGSVIVISANTVPELTIVASAFAIAMEKLACLVDGIPNPEKILFETEEAAEAKLRNALKSSSYYLIDF